MRSAALALSSAVIVAALTLPTGPAASSEPLVIAAAPYGEESPARPTAGSGNSGQAQPAPRRKPSPPVPGQSARGPAYKEECVWVGKRVVSLLARDDAMAAGDFMPFYRQFGCPEDHLTRAFGCAVATTDPSENEALADRIDQCWDDPNAAVSAPARTEGSGAAKDGSGSGQGAQPGDKTGGGDGGGKTPNGT